MPLVIRGVCSGNHPNLRTHVPDDPELFDQFVVVCIGQKPGQGADEFTIRVATPAALLACAGESGIVAQAPLLVVRSFDFNELLQWLEKTVARCQADTWLRSVERLQRYFHWEFAAMEQSAQRPARNRRGD